jgi:hypothetical protein
LQCTAPQLVSHARIHLSVYPVRFSTISIFRIGIQTGRDRMRWCCGVLLVRARESSTGNPELLV